MGAKHHRFRILRTETILHDSRPHPARGAELGDLFEKVVVQIPEERQPLREIIDANPALDGFFDVTNAVGDRERQFLHSGRARLADVVAGDRHGVPARNLARAEFDHVGDDSQRRARRANPFLLRDVLLEHVVLDRSADALPRNSVALGYDQVHRKQNRRRAIHRHRSGDPVERNSIEQRRHVVHGRDRNPFASHFAERAFVVGVVAHQRRHVERGGQPILALSEQEVEARVGVLGKSETRELAHRPQPPAIHRAVHTACVRKLAGVAERVVVRSGHVVGRVERVEFHVGHGRETDRTLACLLVGRLEPFLFVFVAHRTDSQRFSSTLPAITRR